MNSTVNTPKVEQLQAGSKKVFSRGNDEPLYPTYTNAVEFAGLGMDVFMDVGAVAPESVQGALDATRKPGSEGRPTVNVSVLYRFAMTIQTAMVMHQRLTQLIDDTGKAQAEAAAKASQRKEG